MVDRDPRREKITLVVTIECDVGFCTPEIDTDVAECLMDGWAFPDHMKITAAVTSREVIGSRGEVA
jgi:hypothetical protein